MPQFNELPIVGDEEQEAAPPYAPVAPPTVRDSIAARFAQRDQELKALQTKEANDRGLLGIAQGVGQAIAGLSRAGADSFNPAPYKTLEENAKAPVTDFLQREQAKSQGLQQAAQEQKFALDQAANDPTNVKSVVARNVARKLVASVGGDPTMVSDNMSAADVGSLQNPIELMARLKSHRDEMAMRAAEMRTRQAEAKATKSEGREASTFQHTRDALEQMRGNPAVQTAERDIYAADKLEQLARMKDLSPEMVQLVASEAAKIAQGGVPSMHELEGLDRNTAASLAAKLGEFVTNRPRSAGKEAFVKQFQDYANAVRGDAENLITDRYGRIISTSTPDLSREHVQTLTDQYLNRFKRAHEKRDAGAETKDSFPRQVRKDGQVATVSNAEELKEAQAEGWQ